MSKLKVISGGQCQVSHVEEADHTLVGAVYNTVSGVISPLVNIGKMPPVCVYNVPGRVQFADLVVSGDMPLDRKIDIVDNNKKYCGVGVREQLPDGNWLCFVDYVVNNYV